MSYADGFLQTKQWEEVEALGESETASIRARTHRAFRKLPSKLWILSIIPTVMDVWSESSYKSSTVQYFGAMVG